MKPHTIFPLLSTLLSKGLMPATRAPIIATLVALAMGAGVINGPTSIAHAATFAVTRFDDPAPNGCLVGDCSLREAILAANASSDADVINLPAGTYSLTLAGASEDAAATGDLDILYDVTITGQGVGATLDAAALGDRVLHVIGSSGLPIVSMSNVTISGGTGDTAAGLFNVGGSVTLTNVTVHNNTASGPIGNGGGLYNAGLGGLMTLTDCTIADNHASATLVVDNGGGGIFNAGSTLTITNCTLSGNTAEGNLGQGGAIYNAGGPVTISGSTLSGNSSRRLDLSNLDIGGGGGIYNEIGGTITVDSGSIITGNFAYINDGGGIFNTGGVVTVNNSTVSSNTCEVVGCGGGIFNSAGSVTVTGSLVDANSGGGLSNTAGGSMTVNFTTISNNTNTITSGGGIFNSGGTLDVSDSTITGNLAASGGGLFNANNHLLGLSGTATLTNCLISNNTADSSTVASQGGGLWNHAEDGTAQVTLINSTLSGNVAVGSAQGDDMGGGLYNDAYGFTDIAAVTLIDSFVTGNTATDGGGIFNRVGSVTMMGSTVNGNHAFEDGGGLYNIRGTLTLTGSVVDSNAADVYGGGLHSDDGLNAVDVVIDGSTFSNNTAYRGGGLYANDITATLDGALVSGNSATEMGGGLYLDFGLATISNSTIRDNSALTGGGLYLNAGTADVVDTTVSGNSSSGLWVAGGVIPGTLNVTYSTVSANPDGGIIVGRSAFGPSTAAVFNSTISGNSATGITVEGQLTLAYSTVTDNAANGGNGLNVTSAGDAEVWSTILAMQAGGADDCGGSGSIVSTGNNIEGSGTCPFGAVDDQLNTDPLILPLTDNGGPTQTHALTGDSPAIDAGIGGCLTDFDGDGILEPFLDQRGVARVDVPGLGLTPPELHCVDVGAFEYSPLMLNGGLEEDLDADGRPDGWQVLNFGPGDRLDCTLPAHSGVCLVKLQGNGNHKALQQVLSRSGVAGDSYTLSLWSVTNSAMGGALRAEVRFNYTDGTTDIFSVAIPRGTHGWLQSTLMATAAQPYDSMSVDILSGLVSGQVAIDDVALIEH